MYLVSEYAEVLNGEPTLNSPMEKVTGPFPIVLMQDAAKSLRIVAGHDRLDIFRDAESNAEESEGFINWAVELIVKYIKHTSATAGRLALIGQRVTPSDNPAKELSRHFCQDRWIDTAINRPQDFELHSHKCFKLGELFDVNSWVRCKTAIKREGAVANATKADLVFVEQDINSLAEVAELRNIPESELRRFFPEAMTEMVKVLSLYFPTI